MDSDDDMDENDLDDDSDFLHDDDFDSEDDVDIDDQIVSVNENDPTFTEAVLAEEDEGTATEDQMVSLLRGLRRNIHVRVLHLRWTPEEIRRTVCQRLLPPVLRENASIRYLQFPFRMTNAEFLPAARALYDNHNATVTTVDLDCCDVRGREGGEIVARLMQNNHRITALYLDHNEHLGLAGMTCIAAALELDDCALKTLGVTLRDDDSLTVLFASLQKNTSLDMMTSTYNRMTDDSCRALARSLPRVRALKEIHLSSEYSQVSGAGVEEIMEGLRANHSLQVVSCYIAEFSSEEQRRQWDTRCTFVCARNKMSSRLDELRNRTRVAAAREGSIAPMRIPIGPLLCWCSRQGNAEVQASLIHPLLCLRATEFAGSADRQPRKRTRME